mmetsp:Transcript_17655/g.49373  ORF Transcript_17655/g.49373 Transcript_17655/m.49373 type:complete len:241 (+) Transcript_17655:100-822(+)
MPRIHHHGTTHLPSRLVEGPPNCAAAALCSCSVKQLSTIIRVGVRQLLLSAVPDTAAPHTRPWKKSCCSLWACWQLEEPKRPSCRMHLPGLRHGRPPKQPRAGIPLEIVLAQRIRVELHQAGECSHQPSNGFVGDSVAVLQVESRQLRQAVEGCNAHIRDSATARQVEVCQVWALLRQDGHRAVLHCWAPTDGETGECGAVRVDQAAQTLVRDVAVGHAKASQLEVFQGGKASISDGIAD